MKAEERRRRDWRQKQDDLCACAVVGRRAWRQCENRQAHSMRVARSTAGLRDGREVEVIRVCGTHRNHLNRGMTGYVLGIYQTEGLPLGWSVQAIRLAKEGEDA
jgi:hypothetical protein